MGSYQGGWEAIKSQLEFTMCTFLIRGERTPGQAFWPRVGQFIPRSQYRATKSIGDGLRESEFLKERSRIQPHAERL